MWKWDCIHHSTQQYFYYITLIIYCFLITQTQCLYPQLLHFLWRDGDNRLLSVFSPLTHNYNNHSHFAQISLECSSLFLQNSDYSILYSRIPGRELVHIVGSHSGVYFADLKFRISSKRILNHHTLWYILNIDCGLNVYILLLHPVVWPIHLVIIFNKCDPMWKHVLTSLER